MGDYKHLSLYTKDNDDSTFADNHLCPRYAECDANSAPPSPVSMERFDILDNIPWRQSYMSLDEAGFQESIHRISDRKWKTNKTHIAAILLAIALLVIGCVVGVHVAMVRERRATTARCHVRGGGDKCKQPTWAECISRNGLGYCQGVVVI